MSKQEIMSMQRTQTPLLEKPGCFVLFQFMRDLIFPVNSLQVNHIPAIYIYFLFLVILNLYYFQILYTNIYNTLILSHALFCFRIEVLCWGSARLLAHLKESQEKPNKLIDLSMVIRHFVDEVIHLLKLIWKLCFIVIQSIDLMWLKSLYVDM